MPKQSVSDRGAEQMGSIRKIRCFLNIKAPKSIPLDPDITNMTPKMSIIGLL